MLCHVLKPNQCFENYEYCFNCATDTTISCIDDTPTSPHLHTVQKWWWTCGRSGVCSLEGYHHSIPSCPLFFRNHLLLPQHHWSENRQPVSYYCIETAVQCTMLKRCKQVVIEEWGGDVFTELKKHFCLAGISESLRMWTGSVTRSVNCYPRL